MGPDANVVTFMPCNRMWVLDCPALAVLVAHERLAVLTHGPANLDCFAGWCRGFGLVLLHLIWTRLILRDGISSASASSPKIAFLMADSPSEGGRMEES